MGDWDDVAWVEASIRDASTPIGTMEYTAESRQLHRIRGKAQQLGLSLDDLERIIDGQPPATPESVLDRMEFKLERNAHTKETHIYIRDTATKESKLITTTLI